MKKPIYALSEDEVMSICGRYEPFCSDKCPLKDPTTRQCSYSYDSVDRTREVEV